MPDTDPQPLPQDLDAEKAVLGSILLVPDHLDMVRPVLEASDFLSPAHQAVYRAMVALSEDAKPLSDLTLLAGWLDDTGELETVGGRAGVSALISNGIKLPNVLDYARRVKDKAKRRLLITIADHMHRLVLDPADDTDSILAASAGALDLLRGSDSAKFPEVRRLADCSTDPEPVPVLRQAGDRFGAVLSVGEVAVLSGNGKVGKSTLSLQWAMAAAGCPGGNWQEVLGLEVRPGPVVLVSYEDVPRRVFDRARLLSDSIPDRLHVVNARTYPLFGVREGMSLQNRPERLPFWFTLWSRIRRIKPVLVVLDPLTSLMAARSDTVEAARGLIDHLRTEAEKAGCGVLVIAHPNKSARKDGAIEVDPVAGSMGFSDAARGVLVLKRDKQDDGSTLQAATVNYGQTFEVSLDPWQNDRGRFVGFQAKNESDHRPNGRSAHGKEENPYARNL